MVNDHGKSSRLTTMANADGKDRYKRPWLMSAVNDHAIKILGNTLLRIRFAACIEMPRKDHPEFQTRASCNHRLDKSKDEAYLWSLGGGCSDHWLTILVNTACVYNLSLDYVMIIHYLVCPLFTTEAWCEIRLWWWWLAKRCWLLFNGTAAQILELCLFMIQKHRHDRIY